MAKLQRKSAKLFAENASAGVGGVAQFGSLAAGDANYSKDPDIIQALTAYKNGWSAAVVGNKSPAIEDRNALDYLLSYQQAYIMQHGIPEWISTETYYKGSFASVGSALFVSKTDNNIGNNPTTDSTETNWIKFPTPQELADGLALKVNKAGDTMTGNLIMAGGTVYNKVSGTNYRMLDIRDVHIVETYVNGKSWYRIWSDGWCEQGGEAQENVQITFLKPFANTDYGMSGMKLTETSPGGISFDNKTTTSVILRVSNDTSGSSPISWQARGYIS